MVAYKVKLNIFSNIRKWKHQRVTIKTAKKFEVIFVTIVYSYEYEASTEI